MICLPVVSHMAYLCTQHGFLLVSIFLLDLFCGSWLAQKKKCVHANLLCHHCLTVTQRAPCDSKSFFKFTVRKLPVTKGALCNLERTKPIIKSVQNMDF